MKWTAALYIILAANLLFLIAVAAFLAAVTSAAYLQPDPLAVVAQALKDFSTQQTAILEAYLTSVTALLGNHTAVLLRLADYLDAENGRGIRLRECLQDDSKC